LLTGVWPDTESGGVRFDSGCFYLALPGVGSIYFMIAGSGFLLLSDMFTYHINGHLNASNTFLELDKSD